MRLSKHLWGERPWRTADTLIRVLRLGWSTLDSRGYVSTRMFVIASPVKCCGNSFVSSVSGLSSGGINSGVGKSTTVSILRHAGWIRLGKRRLQITDIVDLEGLWRWIRCSSIWSSWFRVDSGSVLRIADDKWLKLFWSLFGCLSNAWCLGFPNVCLSS